MNKEQLEQKIKQAQITYRDGNPIMSDKFYDMLVEELRNIDPDNELINKVEEEIFDRPTIKHPKPMLSTEKAFTKEDLEKWFNRIEKRYGELLYKITPKLDGMAARYDHGQLSTRGDGEFGYDITDAWDKGLLEYNEYIPWTNCLGEIVMTKSYFENNLKDIFEHPRNCIVGAVKCDELSNIQKQTLEDGAIQFVPYAMLPRKIGTSNIILKELDEIIEGLSDINYPIDGFVIEVFDEDGHIKEQLGYTSHHYRWQIAYKTITETAQTTVNNIIYQTGRNGAITPVLEIEPTKLSGAVIRRVTGHNYGYLNKKQIGIDTKIEIVRSGEVIPKVIDVIDNFNKPDYPYQCPICGYDTILDNDIVKCVNIDCSAQVVGRMRHFFDMLDIDLFGMKNIEKIQEYYDFKLNIPQLFDFKENNYKEIGFGDKQAENFVKSIKQALRYEYEDYKILASISIPSVGRGDAKKLLKVYTIDELLDISQQEIENIKGFGEIKAKNIYNGLTNNISIINWLKQTFKIIQTKSKEENMNGILNGKKFVFTGKMENKRDEMKKICEENSGLAQNSISKTTDYLVCGENVGKSKLTKAEKYNTIIINENEFMEMVK